MKLIIATWSDTQVQANLALCLLDVWQQFADKFVTPVINQNTAMVCQLPNDLLQIFFASQTAKSHQMYEQWFNTMKGG